MRHDFLGRMALGLAVVFPITMVAFSMVRSLLVPRYFLPMLPGILLLAVGSAARRSPKSVAAIGAVGVFFAAAVFVGTRPTMLRYLTPERQLALLKTLHPNAITGAVTESDLWPPLNYYIPLQTGFPADLRVLRGPLKMEDLPQNNGLFWVFSSPFSERNAREWVQGLPILCRYTFEEASVYVLARSPEALPAMRGCAVAAQR
jgi:hypothetical protein